MTVIAAYNHFGCGIVISDILINGPVDSENLPQTSLPTLGNVSDFFGGAWGIHKSSQKLCIISDHCAIAWAGSQLYARIFIMRVRKLARRIVITQDVIRRLFEKIITDEISIVGAIYEGESMRTFGFNCGEVKCPTLGDICCAGSGASIISDYVEIVRGMELDVPDADEISARGVSLALTQVAHLLNAEFRKGTGAESILEFFGGGYEIAAYYDGKFQKINSNFVFCDVGLVGGYLQVGNPRLLIAQTYANGQLSFQSVSPQGADNDTVLRNEFVKISEFATCITPGSAHSSGSILNWACFVFVDNFKFWGDQLISLILKSETPPIECSVVNDQCYFSYSERAGQQIEEYLMKVYR